MRVRKCVAGYCSRLCPKFLRNVFCKKLFDFPMAGHGLRNARLRIPIPVMFPAVPNEDASGFLQRADQVDPLHPMDSSVILRMPGISPLVRSR
jgi:hypothetical protein